MWERSPELSSYVGSQRICVRIRGVHFPFSPVSLKTTCYSYLSVESFTSSPVLLVGRSWQRLDALLAVLQLPRFSC